MTKAGKPLVADVEEHDLGVKEEAYSSMSHEGRDTFPSVNRVVPDLDRVLAAQQNQDGLASRRLQIRMSTDQK